MRNLTRFVATLLMGVSLPVVSSMAQTPDPGTSFTSSIVNPTFDSNSNGWDLTTGNGSTGAVSYGVMEVYDTSFELSQTISGLPSGTYQLTVEGFQRVTWNDAGAAYNNGTENISLFLFAKGTLSEKTTPFHSIYSEMVDPSGGWESLDGFVNNMQGASWAFENGYYHGNTVSSIVVGEEGTMTIGIRTVGTQLAGCWAIFDNFNLTYMGEAGLAVYQETISDLENELGTYQPTSVPSGNYKEIQDALAYSNENFESTDTNLLQEVIDSLSNVADRAKAVAPVMEEIQELVASAEEFMSLAYPGLDTLNAVYIQTLVMIDAGGTTPDGELVYQKDLEDQIANLNTAIRNYRFTEPITNANTGVDFTWAMQSPTFTKVGGDEGTEADASSEGWATNNNPAEYSQYRLNHVNGKNCWNSWHDNFVSMDVYQLLEGMPAGFYTFECYQTNNGPEVTDQHAYIFALGGTKNSPYATYTHANDPDGGDFQAVSKWEGPLKTEKVLVGDDGNIRVGFASTSNGNGSSGWFCITDCRLTYYGMDDNAYEEALAQLIESAEELQNEEMLISNANTLANAIAEAKQVDGTDKDAAEAGMAALNEVMEATKADIASLVAFKTGSYAKAQEIAENNDMVYDDEIADLMSGVVLDLQDTLENSDTLTVASFPVFTSNLDKYLTFVDAYQACEEGALNTDSYAVVALVKEALTEQTQAVASSFDNIDEAIAVLENYNSFTNTYVAALEARESFDNADVQNLITSALEDQTEVVANDGSQIKTAISTIEGVISFSNMYIVAMDMIDSGEYDQYAMDLFLTANEQLEIVIEDNSKVSQAEKILAEAISDVRFADLDLEAGENTDVSFVIVNPDTDSTGKTDPVEGWTIVQTDGNANTNAGQHWSGDEEARYLDSWNATAGKLQFTASQVIFGIPNGTYRLTAAVRADGEGAYLYATVPNGTRTAAIPVNGGSGGSIWEQAEPGSEIAEANNGNGHGWNWVSVEDINVNNNKITIGASNVQSITNGVAFAGQWFSATNFQLFWTSNDFYPLGVENIGTDSAELIAYAENGYITVEGADSYIIYTLNGTQVPAHAQLAPGIYIVKAANKVVKVAVK